MSSVERTAEMLEEYAEAIEQGQLDGFARFEPAKLRAAAAALREQPEARGVVDGPIEGTRLPSGGSIESKAKAWDEVVNVMDEVCPDWIRRSKVGAWAVCAAIREMAAAQQPVQEGGGERKGCGDPTCGCDWPSFTEPMEALRFLSGRMKYAGIAEGVARSYARDIDDILAKYDTAPPSAPVGVDVSGYIATVPDNCDRIIWRGHYHHLPLTQQPAQAAPGWKLVPEKATEAMQEAFNDWRPTEGNKYAGAQSVSAQDQWEFRQRYAAMLAATPPGDDAAGGGDVCVWTEQHDGEAWDGGCGATWQFMDGGPADNDMRHCPKCGNRVEIADQKESEE